MILKLYFILPFFWFFISTWSIQVLSHSILVYFGACLCLQYATSNGVKKSQNSWLLYGCTLFTVNVYSYLRAHGVCDIDLGFIIDDSGSITNSNFKKEIEFIKSVASKFNVDVYKTRTSVITFSDAAKIHFEFRDYPGYNFNGLTRYLDTIQRECKLLLSFTRMVRFRYLAS